jgi:hypothetical protein
MPAEIFGLIGRNYVVNAAVCWYSFQNNGISFQVLKVYHGVRFFFAGFNEALLATFEFWILSILL